MHVSLAAKGSFLRNQNHLSDDSSDRLLSFKPSYRDAHTQNSVPKVSNHVPLSAEYYNIDRSVIKNMPRGFKDVSKGAASIYSQAEIATWGRGFRSRNHPEVPTSITVNAGVFAAYPYAYGETEDKAVGIHFDLIEKLEEIAKADGVNLTINVDMDYLLHNNLTYTEAFNLIATDCTENCDKYDMIIADYYITEERSERATFTPPFLEDYLGSIKKIGNDSVEKVCLVPGTAYYDDMISRFGEAASIVDCGDSETCVDNIYDGSCDLFVWDKLPLQNLVACDENLELTDEKLSGPFEIAWAMKTNDVVNEWMSKWMTEVVRSKAAEEIANKWFDQCDN